MVNIHTKQLFNNEDKALDILILFKNIFNVLYIYVVLKIFRNKIILPLRMVEI